MEPKNKYRLRFSDDSASYHIQYGLHLSLKKISLARSKFYLLGRSIIEYYKNEIGFVSYISENRKHYYHRIIK